jgi:hypothetical protein
MFNTFPKRPVLVLSLYRSLDLGVVTGVYTADFNKSLFIKVTTGAAAATVNIPDWKGDGIVSAWLYITQGATARIQTLGAATTGMNNIISSGGLMSAGDALPNSGLGTVDAFEFTWTGTKWFPTNALFDIKA